MEMVVIRVLFTAPYQTSYGLDVNEQSGER